MKKSTVGFLLILLVGLAGIGVWKYLAPLLFEQNLIDTSDAKNGKAIRVAGDNYMGYFFVTSPEMKKQLSRKSMFVDFTDDGGLYAERLRKFDEGMYDCILLPVSSYLQHGKSYKYPGVIVASISESRGADGIVGFGDNLPTGKISDLNDSSLKFVYTGDSPSSFLLDLTITDFDLDRLQGSKNWRKEVDGSQEVLKMAKKNQGDVFVLWEPDLSKALEIPGIKYVWGSDRFSGYIVDVFVFHRDFVKNSPGKVTDFLTAYFRTLRVYSNDKNMLVKDMSRKYDSKDEIIRKQIEKIEWYDLMENAQDQFGIASAPDQKTSEGVINTILACSDVLIRTGQWGQDYLKGNPYLITNSSFLESLSANNPLSSQLGQQGVEHEFEQLNASKWKKLKEIGAFRVEAISFQAGNNLLSMEGKSHVDQVAKLLIHNYPGYRIIIRGHTGPGGDESENEKLSLQRAQVVQQYLVAVHGISKNRFLADGKGSSQPPPKKPGESPRAYRYRLPRVEFVAVEENRF
jgi:outer membrane protein OmpA-like peptidoglycan-associated protein